MARQAGYQAAAECAAARKSAIDANDEAEAAASKARISGEIARKLADTGEAEAEAAAATSSRWHLQVRQHYLGCKKMQKDDRPVATCNQHVNSCWQVTYNVAGHTALIDENLLVLL